jgi:hypothetical protein
MGIEVTAAKYTCPEGKGKLVRKFEIYSPDQSGKWKSMV